MGEITKFIQRHEDQKLCDVLAFCEDGHMRYSNMCCCLLGVFSSEVLHTGASLWQPCDREHYHRYANDPVAKAAEFAYYELGLVFLHNNRCIAEDDQSVRNSYLQEVLRDELERRASLRQAELDRRAVPGQVEVLIG